MKLFQGRFRNYQFDAADSSNSLLSSTVNFYENNETRDAIQDNLLTDKQQEIPVTDASAEFEPPQLFKDK